MFLSKLSFDRRRWDVVHDLNDRDRLHKKILKLFPDYPGGGRPNARELMGVLFRVENSVILLQSRLAPDERRLSPGYKIEGSKDVTANYAAIRDGGVYRFRLDANTSLKVPREGREDWIPNEDASTATRVRLRRVGCGTFEERQRWFEFRMGHCGFNTLDFTMDQQPLVHIKGDAGTFEVTRFEGRLRVEHVESFVRAIQRGIGCGKSYGLGLLSIRNA